MSKTDTFTGLDDAGLVRALAERERELTKLRFQLAASKLQNTSTFGQVRKDIARLQTELRRREIAQGLPKASLVAKHRVDPRSLIGSASSAEAAGGGFLAGVVDKLTP